MRQFSILLLPLLLLLLIDLAQCLNYKCHNDQVLVVQSFGNDTIRMHCQRLDLCGYQSLKCDYDELQPQCGGRLNFVSHVNQKSATSPVEHTCCNLFNPRAPHAVPTHTGNDCFIYELPDGTTNGKKADPSPADDAPYAVLKNPAEIPEQFDGITGYRLRLFLLKNKSPPTLLVKGIERRLDGYRVTICRPRCTSYDKVNENLSTSGGSDSGEGEWRAISWSSWSSSSWSTWARHAFNKAAGGNEERVRTREGEGKPPGTTVNINVNGVERDLGGAASGAGSGSEAGAGTGSGAGAGAGARTDGVININIHTGNGTGGSSVAVANASVNLNGGNGAGNGAGSSGASGAGSSGAGSGGDGASGASGAGSSGAGSSGDGSSGAGSSGAGSGGDGSSGSSAAGKGAGASGAGKGSASGGDGSPGAGASGASGKGATSGGDGKDSASEGLKSGVGNGSKTGEAGASGAGSSGAGASGAGAGNGKNSTGSSGASWKDGSDEADDDGDDNDLTDGGGLITVNILEKNSTDSGASSGASGASGASSENANGLPDPDGDSESVNSSSSAGGASGASSTSSPEASTTKSSGGDDDDDVDVTDEVVGTKKITENKVEELLAKLPDLSSGEIEEAKTRGDRLSGGVNATLNRKSNREADTTSSESTASDDSGTSSSSSTSSTTSLQSDSVQSDSTSDAAGSSSGMNCFSGDTLVTTVTGQKRMDELAVGDFVLVPAAGNVLKYERVEMFYHREAQTRANFVVLYTKSGRRLSLTGRHLLPTAQCAVMRSYISSSDGIDAAMRESRYAEKARRGECVLSVDPITGQLIADQIVRIGRKTSKGIYSPMTVEGSLVADGVLSSCFSHLESHTVHKVVFDFLFMVYDFFGMLNHDISIERQPIPTFITFVQDLSKHIIPFS